MSKFFFLMLILTSSAAPALHLCSATVAAPHSTSAIPGTLGGGGGGFFDRLAKFFFPSGSVSAPDQPLTYREYVVLSAMTQDYERGLDVRERLERWLDYWANDASFEKRARFVRKNRFVRSAPAFYFEVARLEDKGAANGRPGITVIDGESYRHKEVKITDRGKAFLSEALDLYGELYIWDIPNAGETPSLADNGLEDSA